MSARILVVDDVDVNVKVLEAKLSSEYYQVLCASDGMAALELANKEHPDLILLDVMMPRMDGFETCRRLKADPRTADIPVVMVTALSEPADRLRGLEAGVDDFLTKPVNDTALFARVRSLVRLRRMMEEWRHREDVCGRFTSLIEGEPPQENNAPARVLLWESNPFGSARITEILAPLSNDVVCPAEPEELIAACDASIDLVILSMPGKVDALRVVSQLRANEASRLVPILLIGDPDDLPRLAKGLDLGATDYIVRPLDRNELVARARTQIRRKRLQDRLQENYQKSLALALTDGLTGLYNRRYLAAHLDGLFAGIGDGPQHAQGPALLLFDIDWFKRVNDTHGHAAGDAVLKEVASRVLRHVRGFDLVARYGGEEFVVVMPETPLPVALVVAERLRSVIAEKPFEVGEPRVALPITISVGVAMTRGSGETPASLLRRADEALYAAKGAGRNCLRVADADAPAPGSLAGGQAGVSAVAASNR
ncbi:MAG TPA: PleD family two-component system response regulator [Stellaceae bacterium]|nr:PleD family two-component system response regulator [Stellaceae bacterium]